VIDCVQSIEAHLTDLVGTQFASGVLGLALDPVHDQLELARIDVELVRRPRQGASQLRPVERLALSVALHDPGRLVLAPLERGEAPPALLALAPAPDGGAVLGLSRFEGSRLGVAGGTEHTHTLLDTVFVIDL
jgi:hypothetical protein